MSLKYVPEDTQVVLREVPDEISISINFSNCPHRCPGCHSEYLQGDCGEEFTFDVLDEIINKNKGISCLCFFGGDSDHEFLKALFRYSKLAYPSLSVAWYTGDSSVDESLYENLDYIKIGPYIENMGPLNSKTTNQRFYRIERKDGNLNLIDETYKFFKNDV